MMITEEESSNGPKDKVSDLLRFIVVFIIFILPFLQDRASYQAAVEQEVVTNKEIMTLSGYGTAKTVASGIYNFVMTDMGVYRFLYVSLKSEGVPQDKFEAFWAKFLIVSDRIVDNLPLMIYQIGWRLGVAAYWLTYFVPFFAACIYSGVQHWKLSLAQSSGAKIERFRMYRRGSKLTVVCFILYLFIPSAGAASLAKYLVPLGLFLSGVLLNKMIAHYHKLI